MDYAALRKRMVQEQMVARGITNQRVLDAFEKVQRHNFISQDLRANAYADFPIPIAQGQTISQPYIVALMSECLDLKGEEKVLEIGTGSGYQTAILAELAKEVYSIEVLPELSKIAEQTLRAASYNNIYFKVGDGTLGWPEKGPFDRIIITAASPRIPLPLNEQMKENAKMVLPLGESLGQTLTLVQNISGRLEITSICGCIFVPLVGKYGSHEI
jgi:protein-L-isoaspartate(D-aspartate) O-methyltransferase